MFVGNKLTRGEAFSATAAPIDLTRITAPVVVFASYGDNITPPQQALNWIADLYGSVEEIARNGHVIIYTLHESIGHLGIFVSAQVANKQHEQIGSVVKTIELLAPGLYEMLIGEDENGYTVAFEERSIADVLALDDGRDEELEFAAVAGIVGSWATKDILQLTWQRAPAARSRPRAGDPQRSDRLRLQHYFFSYRLSMVFQCRHARRKSEHNHRAAADKKIRSWP